MATTPNTVLWRKKKEPVFKDMGKICPISNLFIIGSRICALEYHTDKTDRHNIKNTFVGGGFSHTKKKHFCM